LASGFDNGEAVKVCVRIRPVVEHEKEKNVAVCLEKVNESTCHMSVNNTMREYR